MGISNCIIIVNDEPYLFWGQDIKRENLEYLHSVNVKYFENIGNIIIREYEFAEDKTTIATLLRINYYHALETFFSLIGALVQGPDCVHGWIQMCSTRDLKRVIERIDKSDNTLRKKLGINKISWHELATHVLQASDKDYQQIKTNIDNFSSIWSKFATEFLQSSSKHEYNAMKHGLRIRSGGFSLLYGLEPEPGIIPPPEAMKTLSHSDFGSTFFLAEQCPENAKANRSYHLRQIGINWDFEATLAKLMLLSLSIFNVVSFLKVINGVTFDQVQFGRPQNPELYTNPWRTSIANCQFNFGSKFSNKIVFQSNRKQLLDYMDATEIHE